MQLSTLLTKQTFAHLMSTEPENKTPELQKALLRLRQRSFEIVASEPEGDWLPLMRNQAAHLGIELDVKDPELQAILDEAERKQNPSITYRGGEALQASESVFLLDGLVKLGEANVIIGQPKVGKSSFSTGLIAALRDRREQFLNRALTHSGERMPVLIFGTDQSEGDWLHFLRREALVDEANVLDPNAVDFFCSLESGQDYNFTREGLRNMRGEIEKHQFPLVVIDSLSSMMEPTGIEENTSRYAQPIRSAISQLRKTGATLLIIHHSVKRPATWDWIVECRGSSSISSVFSWGILMRWVAQEDDGLARTDRRVGFTGKGRGNGETGGVMAEYLAEGGWTAYGSLEAAQQIERVGQKVMELGGVRAQVFDYITQRHELGADVCADEISVEINKHKNAVSRELRILKSKGLIQLARKDGTRPYHRLTDAAAAFWDEELLRDTGSVFPVLSVFFGKENKKNTVSDFQEGEQPQKKNTSPGTPVERLGADGQWAGGWLIRDASNPHAVVVERVGNPMLTFSNLRWEVDVRPCDSPWPGQQAEEQTSDFPF